MRSIFFFFNDTATTEIYTLSLHDALPIYDLLPLGRRAAWQDRLRSTHGHVLLHPRHLFRLLDGEARGRRGALREARGPLRGDDPPLPRPGWPAARAGGRRGRRPRGMVRRACAGRARRPGVPPRHAHRGRPVTHGEADDRHFRLPADRGGRRPYAL